MGIGFETARKTDGAANGEPTRALQSLVLERMHLDVHNAWFASALPSASRNRDPMWHSSKAARFVELDRIRADIERLWLAGHSVTAIADFTWLTTEEVTAQLDEMRQLGTYDVRQPGGFDYRGGRVVPYRAARTGAPRRRRRTAAT